jgi:hypothetical protein
MSDRAQRAEEARRKILDSGDAELIRRLHLLEAAAPAHRPVPPAGSAPTPARGDRGPGLLGMGLAVAGGAWLGTVLGGMTLSGEMQEAFADIASDLGIDMDGVDMANLDGSGFDEAGDVADPGDGFGDFGDFFDV